MKKRKSKVRPLHLHRRIAALAGRRSSHDASGVKCHVSNSSMRFIECSAKRDRTSRQYPEKSFRNIQGIHDLWMLKAALHRPLDPRPVDEAQCALNCAGAGKRRKAGRS